MPDTKWQLNQVHFSRNVLSRVKKLDRKQISKEIMRMWKFSTYDNAEIHAVTINERYKDKYPAAMTSFAYGALDTLTFILFKEFSAKVIPTSNRIERLNRELKRRTEQIGVFPNIESCLKLNELICISYNVTNRFR